MPFQPASKLSPARRAIPQSRMAPNAVFSPARSQARAGGGDGAGADRKRRASMPGQARR